MKIAVMGATSHIAKNLVVRFLMSRENELFLFGRDPRKIEEFLTSNNCRGRYHALSYGAFAAGHYDAVINAVGVSDPRMVAAAGVQVFLVAEMYDNMALAYIQNKSTTRYVHFSSGAVYGTDFQAAVGEDSELRVRVNQIEPQAFYGIAKLNAEAKHRALADRCIIDIRLFSFFSRYLDLDAGFLIADILRSVRAKQPFITSANDIVRDYIHPDDLFALVELSLSTSGINAPLEAYSASPVTKSELLDFFSGVYGLKVVTIDSGSPVSPTGTKSVYFSTNKRAKELGYKPRFTSLECIRSETAKLFDSVP